MIFHCPHCGMKAASAKTECGACGKTMTRPCAGCGERIAVDAKACKYCGAGPEPAPVAVSAPARKPRRRGRTLVLAALVLATLAGAALFVAAGRPSGRTPKVPAAPGAW